MIEEEKEMARERDLVLMRVLTPEGQRILLVGEDSLEASLIGRHWNAIKQYRNYGDSYGLKGFAGQTVTAFDPDTGLPITFDLVDDPGLVKRWAMQGELDEVDPYAELDGGWHA
jgi:hypothetical protein